MNDIRFSVIIPTYNRANRLISTIQSVIQQSFRNWELIIIDDGSKDNTREVVAKFADNRIKYFWQENQERSAARNNGIEKASGEFICFLDSDDVWRVQHLDILNRDISAHGNQPALYFTGMCWNFPDRTENVIFEPLEGANAVEYVIKNQIAPSTTCVHISILAKYKFNTTLVINEDIELFSRIATEYMLIRIPEVTVDFMIHEENTRNLKKDFILTRMKVMKLIFRNPLTGSRISSDFKRWVKKTLRHQLIQYYHESSQFAKMNWEIIRFLFCYPAEPQNKSKLVLLLYHLPGGNVLKKMIGTLK